MGETWGISGPTFLLFYVVLAVVVLVVAIRARRAVTRAAMSRGSGTCPGRAGSAPACRAA